MQEEKGSFVAMDFGQNFAIRKTKKQAILIFS